MWSFGRNWQNVVASNNPLKYCGSLGHRSESNTGLIYMRARYYDPATGRFESEDSAKDGANWSLYAHGDPVNMVDPDGRQSLPETVTTAQCEAEMSACASTGITEGDVLGSSQGVIRGSSEKMANMIVKRVRALGGDEVRGDWRRAAGDAIERFKKEHSMGGADNIGISRNGIFVVDAKNKVIGFVSEILYEMFL